MAVIVLADDGLVFDGKTPEEKAIGGAEGAFIALAEALAARGHEVAAYAKGAREITHKAVQWLPIEKGLPKTADLYIANRSHHLILGVPKAQKALFWIHNPAKYICKRRYLWPLFKRRPHLIFTGAYHASTCPSWVPDGGRSIIPLGVSDLFFDSHKGEDVCPPPVAAFTSNPMRGLSAVLDLWGGRIHPAVPKAELHIYTSPAVHLIREKGGNPVLEEILERAQALADQGVRLLPPHPQADLTARLKESRLMLYPGTKDETFCLAVAEAQVLGVPAVVRDIAAMPERVQDGVTGTVAKTEASFADAAIALLSKEDLWRRMHEAALQADHHINWEAAAQSFETFLEAR